MASPNQSLKQNFLKRKELSFLDNFKFSSDPFWLSSHSISKTTKFKADSSELAFGFMRKKGNSGTNSNLEVDKWTELKSPKKKKKEH